MTASKLSEDGLPHSLLLPMKNNRRGGSEVLCLREPRNSAKTAYSLSPIISVLIFSSYYYSVDT